jgi:hypothetical protein
MFCVGNQRLNKAGWKGTSYIDKSNIRKGELDMQKVKEKAEMMIVEEYVAPLAVDIIDILPKGDGKGKNNCRTDCR